MAQDGVVGGDHGDVAELAERTQRLLDVDDRDLLAAALDDVVFAARDPQKAVGVAAPEVAGAQALPGERRDRDRRLVEVALHEERPFDVELAFVAVGHDGPVGVAHGDRHVGERPSDRPATALELVGSEHAEPAGDLGQAVHVEQAHVGQHAMQAGDRVEPEMVAGAHPEAQRRRRLHLVAERLDDAHEVRRGAAEPGAAGFGQLGQQGVAKEEAAPPHRAAAVGHAA